ncbi:hypothetical protein JCGZ_17484 [Jatropha curcas]|uniref:Uncharacterized protein n=1 Tax=Jatropha curcas TaxID=180498 RepID=A0A067K2J1_JATCU|nr:hypothetical protein JCGZ_17484 [Jatropha curcas]
MGSQVPSSSYSPARDFERSMNPSHPSPLNRQVEQERGPPSPLRSETAISLLLVGARGQLIWWVSFIGAV